MALFTVAAHIGANTNGYIAYDTDTKAVSVHFPDEAVNEQVRQYLTTERSFHRFTSLSQYETVSAVPATDVETLKLALCYIWLALGVHIDWSRPVEA